MKKLTAFAALFMAAGGTLLAQPCEFMEFRSFIGTEVSPSRITPGTQARLIPTSDTALFPYNVTYAYTLKCNGIPCEVLSVGSREMLFTVPGNITGDTAYFTLCVDDGPWGDLSVSVLRRPPEDNDITQDSDDPNKDTQNGPPVESGKDPKPIIPGEWITNPSGGSGRPQNIPCDSVHRIDGAFSEISSTWREWNGIVPQIGKFSHLYIDYCHSTSTLYLLNDWFLASDEPDVSTCYNRFELFTGNGQERWEIRVYHDKSKGTRVLRNGTDVTGDTTYFIAGAYSFGPSPAVADSHTIYEFAIRAMPGEFYLPMLDDPVRPVGPTSVCDDNGNGLIRDPRLYGGQLGEFGSKTRASQRYIPISGVAGLATEPQPISGVLSADGGSTKTIVGSNVEVSHLCQTDNHTVDGEFGQQEWSTDPAIGRFSNLYAEYCGGTLYVMNDWVHGSEEPDENNCYNLFEVMTGNQSEHWGIYVYHNITKGIKVFRNGVDVSADTTFVKGGKYGWNSSPLEAKEHTLYEFGINAQPGAWMLFLADPGPSSFCDNGAPAPRTGSGVASNNSLPLYKDKYSELPLVPHGGDFPAIHKNTVITLSHNTDISTVDSVYSRYATVTSIVKNPGQGTVITLERISAAPIVVDTLGVVFVKATPQATTPSSIIQGQIEHRGADKAMYISGIEPTTLVLENTSATDSNDPVPAGIALHGQHPIPSSKTRSLPVIVSPATDGRYSLSVVDALGKNIHTTTLVLTGKQQKHLTVNLPHALPTGIYALVLKGIQGPSYNTRIVVVED